MLHLLSLSFLLLITTSFFGCQSNTKNEIIKEVQSISIQTSNRNLYTTSDGIFYDAFVTYTDNTTDKATNSVLWKMDDYSKATVTSGRVSANTNQEVNVGISIEYSNFKAYDYVHLLPMTSLKINAPISDHNNVTKDKAYIFSATATYIDNTIQKIQEGNSKNIKWSVDGNATLKDTNDGIATIEFDNGSSSVTLSGFDFNITYNYFVPF